MNFYPCDDDDVNDECDTTSIDTSSMDVVSCAAVTTTLMPFHRDVAASDGGRGSSRVITPMTAPSSTVKRPSFLAVVVSILLLLGTTFGCDAAPINAHNGSGHFLKAHSSQQQQPQQQRRLSTTNDSPVQPRKGRILYIITALAEYNSGTRNTVRGSDRLQETLIPVVSEGVTSMVRDGYDVDVFLVAHFVLLPERAALIAEALPKNVGFDYWNEATPLGYDTGSTKPNRKLENRTLHLARQHRFVIKDKLLNYDMFVVFEDDMLITADHVNHYIAVTNELRRLEDLAPVDFSSASATNSKEKALQQYHGTMTKGQLRRMIPGFMRVEVLLDEQNYPAQSKTGPVPVDLSFTTNGAAKAQWKTVNATTCCYISDHLSNENRPGRPNDDQLMIWETNIMPLGIRQMPSDSWLDWVVLQRGPNQNDLNINETIGDYWSNRNADFYGKKQSRPAPHEFKYINNMGGWMATREQLYVSVHYVVSVLTYSFASNRPVSMCVCVPHTAV